MSGKSIIPEAFKEANKTQVSVGLGVLVALVYGAYHLGQQSAAAAPEQIQQVQRQLEAQSKEQAAKTAQIDVRLEKLVTSTEHMAKIQKSQAKDISAMQERAATMNAELLVISSHVQKRR